MSALPDLAARRVTAHTIVAAQQPDGAIPWYVGGHTDPWDHVECAMALDVLGRDDEMCASAAVRAYDWLAATQRRDGTWPARSTWSDHARGGHREVGRGHVESNFCAYPAVGVAHHLLATGRRDHVERWYPMVARALDAVLAMQLPNGTIAWGRGAGGITDEALVASCASVHQALRAGVWLAESVGETQPDWELAADRLGHALGHHPGWFGDRSRFSMDWYYPVLGGAIRGEAGTKRLAARWDDFVVDDLGIRCVDDHPWVTGAETCELALAMQALGAREEAMRLVADMQHLRDLDGSYWTGYVWPDNARWPIEQSTWTGAAVILACDAIAPTSDAGRLFTDALPSTPATPHVDCHALACHA